MPLWWALERLRARGPGWTALAGLVFGLVAHAGGHLWLWRLVDVFLGGDAALGLVLFVVHALWFAGGFAAYAAVFAALRGRGVSVALAGMAPLLVLEWLQPQLFPVHAGSGLAGVTPLVQIADLGGPLLLSALVAGVDAWVFESLRWIGGQRSRPVALGCVAVAAVAATLAYGFLRVRVVDARTAAAPHLAVGVVQANLGVLEKRTQAREGHERHVALTRELLQEGPLDLVVWPETAQLRAIRGPLPVSGRFVRAGLDVPLLFGGTLVHDEAGSRRKANSAFLVGRDDMIRGAYEKNLLIPLAESVPFGDAIPALAERLPHAQDFAAADETPPLVLGAWRLSTPICYEIVRPAFVRRMVADANPHLLVTLANDAWFGDSQEPWMHLQLARLRAVEHRRYLVRATNSGFSAIVDPAGRIVARTRLLARETLRGRVAMLAGETVYGRFGDWPGWVAAGLLVASFARRRRPAGTRWGRATLC